MLIHKDPQYSCEECGRKFVTKDKLLRHKVIHTGVKAHKCPHCDYHCNVKNNINKHCKNVHGIILPALKAPVRKLMDGRQLKNVDSIVIVHEGLEENSEVVRLQTTHVQDDVTTKNDLKLHVNVTAPVSKDTIPISVDDNLKQAVTQDESYQVQDNTLVATEDDKPNETEVTYITDDSIQAIIFPSDEVKPTMMVIPVVVEESQP